VSVDVAVVGGPFLDLTFEGLPGIPSPGQEMLARRLHVGPGGTGMQAVGAARLGLSVALVSPRAEDVGGRLLRDVLEAEGVRLLGRTAGTTPATALLTTPTGVAMATVLSAEEPTANEVASAGARAIVASLGRLAVAPPGARVYAVTGSLEIAAAGRMFADRGPRVYAFIANVSEAATITGLRDPEAAAKDLTRWAGTTVVTLGKGGAVAAGAEGVARAAAPHVRAVDATGAGDLFVSAYVWADLRGAAMEDRLAWATLYASLSVEKPTALEGALRLEPFLEEGVRRGLTPP
jgi:sugar/nucleoside kinase (ribokinase family)